MKSIYPFFLFAIILGGCKSGGIQKPYGKNSEDSTFYPGHYIVSRIGFPDESPYTEVKKMIGVDMITFKYYSLKADKRTVLGNVVPFDSTWMISDNSPLQISVTSDFYLMDKKLKSGVYSLFLQPKKDSDWTLIVAADTGAHKISNKFQPSNSILKVNVKPKFTNAFTENLTVDFSKDSLDRAEVSILWANFSVPMQIRFDNSDRIFSSVTSHFDNHKNEKKSVSWDEYLEAAQFSLRSNIKLDTGLIWADSSIAKKKIYANVLVKAQILAKQNKLQQALAQYHDAYNLLAADKSQNKADGLKSLNQQITNLDNYIKQNKK